MSRPLKIAMLVPSIGYGTEFETPTISLLVDTLAASTDLHLFPIHAGPSQSVRTATGLTIHPVSSRQRFSGRLVATIRLLAREHRRRAFDVIHALWLHEPGTIAVAASPIFRIPVIASIGGAEVVALPDIAYGALRTARGRFLTAGVLQHATFVTGGSDYVINRARRIVPHREARRFRRIPLPVDVGVFDKPSVAKGAGTGRNVLHAASLIPVKDQVTLLHAFRRVVDLVPDATLTIAGGDPFGHRAGLERLRDQLDLGASVRFVGHLPNAAMPALYHEADLFVLSSRHESQGMVVCEAAAAGVPTVATAVGVARDFAPDAAVVVRPSDSIALGNAVAALLNDPVRRTHLGERARERVAQEYAAGSVRDAFIDLYHEAIAAHRR